MPKKKSPRKAVDLNTVAELAQQQYIQQLVNKVKKKKTLSPSEFAALRTAGQHAHVIKPENPDSTSNQVYSQRDLANSLGVAHRMISLWRRAGAPAPSARGAYDISAWRTWMKANGKDQESVAPGQENGDNRGALENKVLAARARRLEMENKVREGQLTTVDQMRKDVMTFLASIRFQFLKGYRGIVQACEAKNTRQEKEAAIKKYFMQNMLDISTLEWPKEAIDLVEEFLKYKWMAD